MKFIDIIKESKAMDEPVKKGELNIAIDYVSTSDITSEIETAIHGLATIFDRLNVLVNLTKALDVPFDLLLEAISFLNEGEDENE